MCQLALDQITSHENQEFLNGSDGAADPAVLDDNVRKEIEDIISGAKPVEELGPLRVVTPHERQVAKDDVVPQAPSVRS